jgi:hypothetical protein
MKIQQSILLRSLDVSVGKLNVVQRMYNVCE